MTDREAEVWAYTFERAPDFTLTIHGETIGRVYHCTVRAGGPQWIWTIVCVIRWRGVGKTAGPMDWEAPTKDEAIAALRAGWAEERDWRRGMREVTATTHGCWPPALLACIWRGHEVD